MALIPKSPFLTSLKPINTCLPSKKPSLTFKNLRVFSSIASSNEQEQPKELENDAIKNFVQSNLTSQEVGQPVQEFGGVDDYDQKNDGLASESVKFAFEKAKEYKKKQDGVGANSFTVESSEKTSGDSENSLSSLLRKSSSMKEIGSDGLQTEDKNDGNKDVPLAVKLALEKAKKYKVDNGVGDSSASTVIGEKVTGKASKDGSKPETTQIKGKAIKNEELRISSMDFVGLGFSDKKKGRGLPAGLVYVEDSLPEGDLPEVEIIVGDASKFGDETATTEPETKEDEFELYKPKVSTWGVFPRPNDISKTFGGGRTIRPGEVLEKAEDKAAKDARTRQLVAAYKSQIGMNIDPKLKLECEKVLKDGDVLMDLGNLKEALPFYEKIMEKLPFKTELHGLAALQWSICQDSLSRSNEARMMYEKLQSHPNPQVNKKAKQFMFSFQAMEMMKVNSSSAYPVSIGYRSYFEAFVREKTSYSSTDSEINEDVLAQAFPYVLFLVSPILLILIIVIQKGS
ncbi:hypothetical protein Leryth_015314 [Lithospermum erythrorhizon]|nr:hypothetical protein Leryth_015314 [Lithospermum erythrorhizon]